MKAFFLFIFELIIISPNCTKENIFQSRVNEELMPILAWDENNPDDTSVERFYVMKEAGITHNFINGVENADQLLKYMDAAHEVGIKMLIWCPELMSDTEEIVKRFKDHPAIAAYHLKDEPSKDEFQVLGDLAKVIQSIDDSHFCLLNLLPNYATKKQLGTNSYCEYICEFIKKIPTPVLSFDHYPIKIIEGKREVNKQWYENLEIIAKEAQRAGKTFWAFALTASHWSFPPPTLDDLRLQVYSNLAYGAQGIQYFNWLNINPDFTFTPIDNITGEKTNLYYYVQTINQELRNLSKVFLNSTVISVKHTGTIPSGTTRLEVLPPFIKSLETIGLGAIVSLLEDSNNQYIVVVNRDINEKMKVRIEVTPTVKRILKDGTSVRVGTGVKVLTLAPGDVLIYEWEK